MTDSGDNSSCSCCCENKCSCWDKSSSSEELSEETEDSTPRHTRQYRSDVNRLLFLSSFQNNKIPVYCSANGLSAPPGAVIINSNTGTVCTVPSKSPTVLSNSTKPLLTTPYGPILDMATLIKSSKNPTALIFIGFNPRDVWVMFQFYLELIGITENTPVSDAFRLGDFDVKSASNHAMFSLATSVGANIFREAIQSNSDSYPEVAMTKLLVDNKSLFKRRIPYVVIPRMESFRIKGGNVVVVDGSVGVYLIPTPSISDRLKGYDKLPKWSFNSMSLSTYMNLTALVKIAPHPKLIVFSNVAPSGVLAMVNFYERIVDPTICLKDPGCKHTIYSAFDLLHQKSMKQIQNNWMVLARICLATPFETILRRT